MDLDYKQGSSTDCWFRIMKGRIQNPGSLYRIQLGTHGSRVGEQWAAAFDGFHMQCALCCSHHMPGLLGLLQQLHQAACLQAAQHAVGSTSRPLHAEQMSKTSPQL